MSAPRGSFGLLTLTCVVIASMIGAGVFTTSGYSLAALGSPLRVMAAWSIGGLIAICGAIAYGELSREIPLSGGEYVYLSRRLHPFAGFLAGWISLTAGFSGAIALAALTFQRFLLLGIEPPSWLPANSVAITAILVFGLGHAFLVKPVATIQNVIVAIKLSLLLAFLVVCGFKLGSHEWHVTTATVDLPTITSRPFISVMATSVMWISLSYLGFNGAVYVAAEADVPEKTVRRSLVLGTLTVTVFYLLLNLAFVTAADVSQLSGQEAVAAKAAFAIGGSSLELTIRAAAVLGTLTSIASMIMTGSRVISRMAYDGLFFDWFRSGPSATSRTVLLQTFLAISLVQLRTLPQMIEYLSTTLAVSSTITVATLLPRLWRPQVGHSRLNAATLSALLYCISMLVIIGLMIALQPRDLRAAAITLAVGFGLWLLTRTAASGKQTE